MSDFLQSPWFTIIALSLSVPLGIASNLITPRIAAWWALRSRKSLQSRIATLKREIAQTAKVINSPSYAVAQFADSIAICLTSSTTLIMLVVIVASFPWPEDEENLISVLVVFSKLPPLQLLASALAATITTAVFSLPYFWLHRYAQRVSNHEAWERKTIDELDRLEERLNELQAAEEEGN